MATRSSAAPLPKPASAAPRDLDALLAEARAFSAEFPPFMASHLTMMLVALKRLGASEARLAEWFGIYRDVSGLVPMPPATLTAAYTLVVAFLMVSRLPVFSGKAARWRVEPEMVLTVFVAVVFAVAVLIGYPWHILSVGSVIYLLSLPLGWKSYRDQEREFVRQAGSPLAPVAPERASPYAAPTPPHDDDERPPRLN